MKNDDIKQLALKLVGADTEEDVIKILKEKEYWDNESFWHEYGDNPQNYSIIGNQQSSPDNALVEKLVNSVDAVLMRECLKRRINPSGDKAPQTIAQAQREFFDIRNGALSNLDSSQRAQLAKENIWLVATGARSNPSFSIIDKGEGQSPKRIPETILSLTKDNKIKISFVQGKFGMGGSGVLRFCGGNKKGKESNLMLVISKRNHEISNEVDNEFYGTDETRNSWGVTVVRRENPHREEMNSRYTYLAPEKKILSFDSGELLLWPSSNLKTFDNPLRSGTFIKLYEYNIGKTLGTAIYFNLYYRLALLMLGVALPIRMLEQREYRSDGADQTLAGLHVRLAEADNDKLEPSFRPPSTGHLRVEDEELGYAIYVFKPDKKKNYAKDEGIIFSINGQTHGSIRKDFFKRQKVGMSYLEDSILIIVDCSKMSRRQQEVLFMPSRDRLSNTALDSIKNKLENIVKNHSGLKALQNERRNKSIENTLQDSKPLKDILANIIEKSQSLSNLLQPGQGIPNPFNRVDSDPQKEFKGKKFPSYFKLNKKYEKEIACPKNQKSFSVKYATDAENDYFSRAEDPGEFSLEYNNKIVQDYSLDLYNGLATLTIGIPPNVGVGDKLSFKTEVSDIDRVEPFADEFSLHIKEERIKEKSNPGDSKEPISSNKSKPSESEIPEVIQVRKHDWDKDEYKEFRFDEYSALKVKNAGEEKYDFFINMDNLYLKSEMKNNKINPNILEKMYQTSIVLMGMSILKKENSKNNSNRNKPMSLEVKEDQMPQFSVEDQISQFTEAISHVIPSITTYFSKLEHGN